MKRIAKTTAFGLALLALLVISAADAGATANKEWYAQRLENLGFYVFDKPFTFQDFAVEKLEGGARLRSASKGNIVLLNFWATWCPPCKEEIPSIQKLSDTLKGEKFEVFAVNLGDDKKTVSSFVAEWKLTFPIYLDQRNLLSGAYASQGIPTTYILDKDGKFVAGMVGSYDYTKPELVALLKEMARK